MEQPQITLIPLDLIDPHPNNLRGPVEPDTVEDLAASIREKGVLEPLLVVPVRNRGQNWKIDRYTAIAGHRRRAAAKLAGLSEVPAIIRDLSPAEQEEVMLVENLQRQDLTLLQEAQGYQRLMEKHKLTQADVARRVGVSRERVQQRMGILKLPEAAQQLFNGRDMPITAVPLLLKVENPDRQERLAQMIASRKLAVPKLKEMIEKEADAQQTDRAVDKSRKKKPATSPIPAASYTRADAIADLERLNGAGLKYSDVLEALNLVCDHCGMSAHTSICAACPLPQLIDSLVNHVATQTV
jgi:ParB family chromosome partitioning protein